MERCSSTKPRLAGVSSPNVPTGPEVEDNIHLTALGTVLRGSGRDFLRLLLFQTPHIRVSIVTLVERRQGAGGQRAVSVAAAAVAIRRSVANYKTTNYRKSSRMRCLCFVVINKTERGESRRTSFILSTISCLNTIKQLLNLPLVNKKGVCLAPHILCNRN